MEFIRSDTFLIILFVMNIILVIISIIGNVRIKNIRKNGKEFMTKLGDGKDLKEDLDRYMNTVKNTEKEIKDVKKYCKDLSSQLEGCTQKIGIVRYNAYKDTGSDLSFALALLDEKNNGVVLNGIYSREMSNIYAKPIIDGKSTYTLTSQENDAIYQAINGNEIKKVN